MADVNTNAVTMGSFFSTGRQEPEPNPENRELEGKVRHAVVLAVRVLTESMSVVNS